MAEENIADWSKRTWELLASIPFVSEVASRERNRWEEFQTSDTLEVVIFGAYDSGKSSLLKRLLVDWDTPIPEWLTVSGRRETFEAKRIQAKRLGLIDTPGLGSGNSKHDDLTLSAMRLADAYLWVLPPQLVTTGKEQFWEVLFGDVGIADATIAVIARMDEAGVDPSYNETGFFELCDRKKAELSSIVNEASDSENLYSIYCVAADPYQMVGNTSQPGQEIYDGSRGWDGMDDLAKTLLGLRERRHELRSAAQTRFLFLLLSDLHDELQRLLKEHMLRKEEIDKEVERHEVYEQKIDTLQRQAKADLRKRTEDALLSIIRSGRDTGAESIRDLEGTLTEIVNKWAEESFEDYRRLADELELEASEWTAATDTANFRRLAEEAEKREAKGYGSKVDPVKAAKRALACGPALRKAFRTYAKADLGMPLEQAAEHLKKFESVEEAAEKFRGIGHAKKADKFVRYVQVIDAISPVVEQLGDLIVDTVGEARAAKQAEERAEQRRELQRKLRVEAEKLREAAAADFNSTCDELRQWVANRRSATASVREELSKQIKNLKSTAASVKELIDTVP